MPSRLEKNDFVLETVLVLQGGGSLGAYECGVYKALARHVKKFDLWPVPQSEQLMLQ